MVFLQNLNSQSFLLLNVVMMLVYVTLMYTGTVRLKGGGTWSRAVIGAAYLTSAAATGIGIGVFLQVPEFNLFMVEVFSAMLVWGLILGYTLSLVCGHRARGK